MPYARAGKDLELDLSLTKVETKDGNSELNEAYLGGRGIATRIFWDRVSPETHPFSPENLLIFSVGLLTGTLAPGANRAALITRSPQTKLLTYSTIGGFWGSELKHAGYDNLIISGKSSKYVYLWINDDKVEVRDASHLWGKDVEETKRIIRKELNNDKVQILCIGPAGENKVYAATIEHGFGSGASRAGVGAVMGDKNLKAIAVCGSKDLNIARSSEFNELCQQILKKTDKLKSYYENWSNDNGVWLGGEGVYRNFDEIIHFEDIAKHLADFENKHKERITTCYNCGLGCKFRLSLPGGASSFVKCQSYFNFMFACQIHNLEFSLNCYHLCERYGMDVISTAHLVAFAIDIYQKGILSKKDTEGMHLDWGNEKVAFSLIEKIAQREGIGEILANGVYEASRIIGNGAEEHTYHLKKLESIPYGMYRPYSALRSSVADKPDATRAEGYVAQEYLGASKEWKKKFLKSGYFSYPKELEKLFMDDFIGLERDYETIVPFTSCDVDKNCIADCTGVCIFWTGFWCYNPINLDDHINLISYSTGLDLELDQAMSIAKRIGTLTRAYNVITGIRRKDDRVPEKYFQITPKPPYFKLDEDKFNKMISKYYNLRGWNSEGIPSKEELDNLGLDFVRRDLEQREIL